MGIASWFRGRITFFELLDHDIKYLQTLKYIMYIESRTKQGKDAKAGEVLEDELKDNVTGGK